MTTMTINGKELTEDQIRTIRISLSGFLMELSEPSDYTNEKMDMKYKIRINEIFKLMMINSNIGDRRQGERRENQDG